MLDYNEIKTVLKYLKAVRILFVIAGKEHSDLDSIISKLKRG